VAVVAVLAAATLAAPGPLAAAPARAEATGAIAGTVTDASTHLPVAGIRVCAPPPPPAVESEEGEGVGELPPPACATTAASGEYTISGLAPGSYFVVFAYFPPLENNTPQPNYVPQAYEAAYTEAAAKKVTVTAGATTSGIDAALQVGGQIAGRVTDAATGAPLAGAGVCALQRPLETLGNFGCAVTGASGEYTISGLAGGGFDVAFFAEGRLPQVYNGVQTLSEATIVPVTPGQLSGGINAALAPAPPQPPEPAVEHTGGRPRRDHRRDARPPRTRDPERFAQAPRCPPARPPTRPGARPHAGADRSPRTGAELPSPPRLRPAAAGVARLESRRDDRNGHNRARSRGRRGGAGPAARPGWLRTGAEPSRARCRRGRAE
jgi:hypothetical protein